MASKLIAGTSPRIPVVPTATKPINASMSGGLLDISADLATEEQAVAGTANDVLMTPLTTAAAVGELSVTAAAGLDKVLPIPFQIQPRPGEGPSLFTNVLDGDPDAVATLNPANIEIASEGPAYPMVDAAIIATRAMFAIEPGRRYVVASAATRVTDPGNLVTAYFRTAVAWFDANGQRVQPVTVIEDWTDFSVVSGRRTASAVVARSAGDDVDFVAPAAARFARPYAQTFGVQKSLLEYLRFVDPTDADIAVAGLSARIDANEAGLVVVTDGLAETNAATALNATNIAAEAVARELGDTVQTEAREAVRVSLTTALARDDFQTGFIDLDGDGRFDLGDGIVRVRDDGIYGELDTLDEDGRATTITYPSLTLNVGTNYNADPSWTRYTSDEIHQHHNIGQSLAQGRVDALRVTTGLYTNKAMMLSAGAIPFGRPSSGFVDLIGGEFSGSYYEPPVLFGVNRIVKTLADEYGIDNVPMMVATCSAFGGQGYLDLMPGSSRWQESRRIFQEVKAKASALGKKVLLKSLFINLGEQDAVLSQSGGAFSNASGASVQMAMGHIMRLVQEHEELAWDIYDQTEQVIAILHVPNRAYTSGSPRLCPWTEAVTKLCAMHPGRYVAAIPTYAVEFIEEGETGDGHPNDLGYYRLGDTMGFVAARAVYGTGFQNTEVRRWRWTDDDQLTIDCHVPMGGNLAIDTSENIVGDPGAHCGIVAEDDAGALVVTTSVSGQSIILDFDRPARVGGTIVGGACLNGGGFASADNTNMARTNIRGSNRLAMVPLALETIEDTGFFLSPFVIVA